MQDKIISLPLSSNRYILPTFAAVYAILTIRSLNPDISPLERDLLNGCIGALVFGTVARLSHDGRKKLIYDALYGAASNAAIGHVIDLLHTTPTLTYEIQQAIKNHIIGGQRLNHIVEGFEVLGKLLMSHLLVFVGIIDPFFKKWLHIGDNQNLSFIKLSIKQYSEVVKFNFGLRPPKGLLIKDQSAAERMEKLLSYGFLMNIALTGLCPPSLFPVFGPLIMFGYAYVRSLSDHNNLLHK